MKTKVLNIIGAIMVMLAFAACSSDHTSDLKLSGDCKVETFALDGYVGNIDFTTRSIVVRLPEVYETSAMKVTALAISDGAQSSISLGQTLNMDAAKVMHISNGDVFLDWTISVLRDEARIYQFVVNDIYRGNIDQEAKTITIYVPASVDITNLVPTIDYSANATITPATGVGQDFSQPVTYTVTNNSAESTYTVKVIAIDKPKALFIGAAATMDDLDPEAKEACTWMMSNVEGTLYASFADIHGTAVLTVTTSSLPMLLRLLRPRTRFANSTRMAVHSSSAVMLPTSHRSSASLVTMNGPHLTTVGVRTKTRLSFAVAHGTSRFIAVRTIILCGRTSLPVTILMPFTALMPVITSPTLLPSITSVPTGVAMMTTTLGQPARVLPSSV